MADEDVDATVRAHYGRDDLEADVFAALARHGADLDALTLEDLSGIDHLHAGFVPATVHLLHALDLSPGTTLLDVGSGVGGPARHAAARHGCTVAGIDLSPHFVRLATELTRRVGLADRVRFDVGSAVALPYADGSFARAMLDHVGMNIEAKDRVFAEVRRVLEPGGLFAVYEQMRTADGTLRYPMPWADDERSSFVETRDRYGELLRAAGFVIEHDENCAATVAAPGPPPAGALTPVDLFGPGFVERIGNNVEATARGVLSPVLLVARAA